MNQNPEYLSASQVRARFGGVSHMFLFRAMRDRGFPAPVRFGGRLRFWRIDDLVSWERSQIARDATAPKTAPPRRSK